jgi:hypothetical protein
MEFITQEVATTLSLSPEQIAGITPLYDGHLANLKKEWDGKANTNAEGIINGALSKINEVTKVARLEGEKAADYITRAGLASISEQKTNVSALELEYQNKLKEFKGDEATKLELQNAKTELDNAKKILADFDNIKAKADKYDETEQTLSKLKLQVSFSNVKPKFPDIVNAYEAKAKWEEFKNSVLEKYEIQLVDGEAIAVDKTNNYTNIKLSELVKNDKNITELLAERQQAGTGARASGNDKSIEGLPFKVPQDAKTNTSERAKVISEQLTKEGIAVLDPNYTKKFAEYNLKIMQS